MFANAVHEAGHAVAALALGFHVQRMELFSGGGVTQIADSFKSNTEAHRPESAHDPTGVELDRAIALTTADAGFRAKVVECFRATYPDEWLIRRVIVSVAGRTAEARVSGQVNYYGASADEESEEIMLDALRDQRWPWRWRQHCTREAEWIVDEHWPAIVKLAAALSERRRLDGPDVRAIVARQAHEVVGMGRSR